MISISYFANRMYCAQYLKMFEEVAHTITQEHIEDAYEFVREQGYIPEFGYFIDRTEKLANELTMRARWMTSEYKEGRGGKGSITLTTSFKRVIRRSVDEYLQATKALKSMHTFNIGRRVNS